LRNRLAYALAALIFGVSLIGYTIAGVSFTQMTGVRLQEIGDAVTAMPRVPVPGQSDIQLPEAGEYTIFYEAPSGQTGSEPPELQIEMKAEDGGVVQIHPTEQRISYEFDRSGVSVHQFQVSRPGRYQVVARYPEGGADTPAVLAFGMGLGSRIEDAVGHGGWWLLWTVGITIAVVIAALTYFGKLGSVPNRVGGADPSPQ
jgi:hypothetical protein